MCMLTAIGADPIFAFPFITAQLSLNSLEGGNDDGVGFWKDGEMWKTKKCADNVTNLGKLIWEIVPHKDSPILAHVRAASPGVTVSNSNAHPFYNETAGIILAHNGKLTMKKESVEYKAKSYLEKKEYSDSLLFLDELSKVIAVQERRNIPKALQDTMSNFTGKFAFLISDTITGDIYAARGTTAPLYKSRLGIKGKDGYIINTNDESLISHLYRHNNRLESLGLPPVMFEKPIMMEANSIFLLSKRTVTKIDSLVENRTTYTPKLAKKKPAYADKKGNTSVPVTPDKDISKVAKFMVDHLLSPADIDLLFIMTQYVPLAEASITDVEEFVKNIQVFSAPVAIRYWLSDTKQLNSIPESVYTVSGFQWPWMLNKPNAIKQAIDSVLFKE